MSFISPDQSRELGIYSGNKKNSYLRIISNSGTSNEAKRNMVGRLLNYLNNSIGHLERSMKWRCLLAKRSA